MPTRGLMYAWKFGFPEELIAMSWTYVELGKCAIVMGQRHRLVLIKDCRHPISNVGLWNETAVSGVLRAILDDNDEPDGNDGQPLLGLRKLDPLPTLADEKQFL